MNANNGAMEYEYTKNDGVDRSWQEPGCSGTQRYDYPRPYNNSKQYKNSGSHDGSRHDYYRETNDLEPKEKSEPLFVVDRTKNFKLQRAIKFESSPISKGFAKAFGGHRQSACWNCDSPNHSLTNCPEPRNHRKVTKNRQSFLYHKNQFGPPKTTKNRSGKNSRYFVGGGTQPPWNDLTPGKLSDNLKNALGVPKDGLPVHIYRMREHGYPSGWLEDAREEYSGISIYTTPNECSPPLGRESGVNDYFHFKINENKLHAYPGFNAPCPPGVVDEGKKYGCPEYNPDQSLKNMYDRIKSGQIGTTETVVSSASSPSQETVVGNTLSLKTKQESKDKPPSSPEDGEITDDDSRSDNNDEKSPSNETVPGNDEKNNSISIGSSADTQNDSQSNVQSNVQSNSQSKVQSNSQSKVQSNSQSNVQSNSQSIVQSNSQSNVQSNSQSNVSNSKMVDNELVLTPTSKRKFGDVKSETLGTPVLKNFSAYKNRPTHEHFAKGMVDMVDHENLPNSIGTFKKLKEILKDVRKTIKDLI